jgi:2-oxoisovalerate dehydrogenase E1 component alpha subunit
VQANAERDTVVATFEVRRRQYLDEQGNVLADLPDVARDRDLLRKIYRFMSLSRALDAKFVSLQRTGRSGTYAPAFGQEAVPIGLASAMRETDVLVPSYREGSAQIWRGVEIGDLLQYFAGSERGQAWSTSSVQRDLPICITVGNQALHAAGVAAALKYREKDAAAVCVFGDGATSKGDVYAAINIAGAWNLPVVFIVTNNQWAISTPRSRQSAAETLGQKGIAGGIAVLQTDGNDVLAVHDAAFEALARARGGGGATFIECVTYRLQDHNTADDSTRYRDAGEVERHRVRCPLRRLRAFMQRNDFWSDEEEQALAQQIAKEIDAAVERHLDTPGEGPEAMFDYLYAELPAAYAGQRAEAVRQGNG